MNLDKMIELRDFMAVHPEQVHMNTWLDTTSCGTTACAAGHAALLDGVLLPDGDKRFDVVWRINPDTKTSHWMSPYDEDTDDRVSPFTYSRDVLGLSEDQACRLFLNTRDHEVIRVLDAMIEEARTS